MPQITVAEQSAPDLYGRLERFFEVQGYPAERQIPNQQLSVRLKRVPVAVYWLVGLVLLIPQTVIAATTLTNPAYYLDGYFGPATVLVGLPAALMAAAWLLWAMPARLTLSLRPSTAGTSVAAEVKGRRARDVWKRLAGQLALEV